jgi:hypothetical protein
VDYLQQWVERKRVKRYAYLNQPLALRHTYRIHIGPRYIYGALTLAAQPADTFAFISAVTWPEDNYDSYVLDGILDVLVPFDIQPLLGATFVLQAIEWHDVDSAAVGYYRAAKEATRQILRLDTREPNVTWRL